MEMTTQVQNKVKMYHAWKIGQINIQSCSDDIKLDFTLQECNRANLDVVCIQEVRRLNSGSVNHLGYNFFWNGLKRCKRHGVGIAIKECSYITIESILNHNERMMAADITVQGCKIRIVSCYAPTLQTAFSTKQAFYRDLTKICQTEHNRKVIIEGDFNAELKACRMHSCFDGSSAPSSQDISQDNENAVLFLEFCHKMELSILNTWYCHPLHHRVTWHHPNGHTKKVYDYSLSRSWLRQFVNNVRVRNSYFHSDHRMVVTHLKTPANKAARRFKRPRRVNNKVNMECLQNDEACQNVRDKIADYIEQNTWPTSLDEMHMHLINALKNGKQQLPKMAKIKQTIPWKHDEVLADLHSDRITIRKQPDNEQNKAKLKQLGKNIKARVKVIQNKILKNKGQELNEAKQHRQVSKLWKKAKSHDSVIIRKPKPIPCPGLDTHFKKHFNQDHSSLVTPEEIIDPPDYIQILQDSNNAIINSSPSTNEISAAIKQLNNGKSSIDIEPEIIKLADSVSTFKDSLKDYFDKIWTDKEVPKQWRSSKITPIRKRKGSV